ncbi:MAG TPA: hypothetical protein V6C57_15675 [Coleofasciculaceae cyanobacterium]
MVASTKTRQTSPSTRLLPQREATQPSAWVDDLFHEVAIETPASKSKASKSKKTRKSKAKPKKAVDLNQVAPLALGMSRSDRFQLIEMLQQFNDLEADEMEEAERIELIAQESTSRRLSKGRSAHVELKVINGCGPYRYLRWWCGSTHKSTYIGKD